GRHFCCDSFPTRRSSDLRLMLDYIASVFGYRQNPPGGVDSQWRCPFITRQHQAELLDSLGRPDAEGVTRLRVAQVYYVHSEGPVRSHHLDLTNDTHYRSVLSQISPMAGFGGSELRARTP